MKYLLDTHVWIWWLMRPQKLSGKVKRVIGDSSRYAELLLSAISVWEFCKLLEKGRLGVSCEPETWLETALAMPKLRLVPLSPVIACRSTTLPQPLFSSDPADQIIVATAREENATILTRDEAMHRYASVRTVW